MLISGSGNGFLSHLPESDLAHVPTSVPTPVPAPATVVPPPPPPPPPPADKEGGKSKAAAKPVTDTPTAPSPPPPSDTGSEGYSPPPPPARRNPTDPPSVVATTTSGDDPPNTTGTDSNAGPTKKVAAKPSVETLEDSETTSMVDLPLAWLQNWSLPPSTASSTTTPIVDVNYFYDPFYMGDDYEPEESGSNVVYDETFVEAWENADDPTAFVASIQQTILDDVEEGGTGNGMPIEEVAAFLSSQGLSDDDILEALQGAVIVLQENHDINLDEDARELLEAQTGFSSPDEGIFEGSLLDVTTKLFRGTGVVVNYGINSAVDYANENWNTGLPHTPLAVEEELDELGAQYEVLQNNIDLLSGATSLEEFITAYSQEFQASPDYSVIVTPEELWDIGVDSTVDSAASSFLALGTPIAVGLTLPTTLAPIAEKVSFSSLGKGLLGFGTTLLAACNLATAPTPAPTVFESQVPDTQEGRSLPPRAQTNIPYHVNYVDGNPYLIPVSGLISETGEITMNGPSTGEVSLPFTQANLTTFVSDNNLVNTYLTDPNNYQAVITNQADRVTTDWGADAATNMDLLYAYEIADYNNIADPNVPPPGVTLVIPYSGQPGGSVTVVPIFNQFQLYENQDDWGIIQNVAEDPTFEGTPSGDFATALMRTTNYGTLADASQESARQLINGVNGQPGYYPVDVNNPGLQNSNFDASALLDPNQIYLDRRIGYADLPIGIFESVVHNGNPRANGEVNPNLFAHPNAVVEINGELYVDINVIWQNALNPYGQNVPQVNPGTPSQDPGGGGGIGDGINDAIDDAQDTLDEAQDNIEDVMDDIPWPDDPLGFWRFVRDANKENPLGDALDN